MEYKGKLYGHLGGKMYFDTGKTADDWDELEKRVAELEAENQALRQPSVSGTLPTMQEIKTSLYKCAKVTMESDCVKMERLFEKEAKAMLALFGGNDH